MKRVFRTAWIFVLISAISAWTRSAPAEEPGASDLAEIRRSGKLTMLCWPHQESSFVRRMVAEYGAEGLRRYTGIDVEILLGFAESLGVVLDIQPMRNSFAELIPALLAGEGQLIGSSLTITEGRSRKVDFSVSYHGVKKVVVTRRDQPLETVADFAGRTAAVVAGSSHEEHLLALGVNDLRLLHTQFTLENYTAVEEGAADFTVVDSDSAARVLEGDPELASALIAGMVFPRQDDYGFAVAPGSDLLQPLDAYIEQLRQSGELARIKARFLRN